jgi:DNA-binding transcriptional LysR family regulator
MIELKQLQYFLVVADELHFGRAATRLHITQSPLSRQIQLLEYTLQFQLFRRTNRSVQLTPAGHAFRAEARHLLAQAENAVSVARRHSQGQAGVLKMGFTAGSSYRHLPRMLEKAGSALKDVEIVLEEMVTVQQVEALKSNQIDFGLGRQPPNHQQTEGISIAREALRLAVPSAHRFARKASVALGSLQSEPIITFSPKDGFYFYALIDSIFRRNNMQPTYVQHVSQIHSILALVSAGLGVALVPETAEALHFENVRFKKLDMPPVHADLYLIWRKNNENPAVQAFIRLMRKRFAIT